LNYLGKLHACHKQPLFTVQINIAYTESEIHLPNLNQSVQKGSDAIFTT